MGKSVDISGKSFVYLVFGVQVGVFGVLLVALLRRSGGFASVALALFFAFVAVAMVVGLWRVKTDNVGEWYHTPGDPLHDPLAPGQMAKDRWLKAVSLLPDGDDEDDEDDED
ncbi:hypothetical protein [Halopelagius longus]|uniref:Uncharacterized protein n=1 Tax=Halopelagius longus TaxID=1236180 RepID=A0A1H1BS33_9EURY|nr:hypothetical protein [Halopelagius longus]RDI70900.1 hypothetical protein DWB78_03680 [Halopelagius longus]SDQ54738.1 hypothetical protein SAMN05216278_1924 [Halopelagius longus]